jgi:hypothetical protein
VELTDDFVFRLLDHSPRPPHGKAMNRVAEGVAGFE